MKLTPADISEMAVALDDAIAEGHGDDACIDYIAAVARVPAKAAYRFFYAEMSKRNGKALAA